MADVPIAMGAVGSATLTGKQPLTLAGGHTTYEATAGMWGLAPQISSKALTVCTMSRALTTNNLIKNIKTAIGYLPPGITVIGFAIKSADLDSGSPALIQSLYLGATVAVTGITTGQGATNRMYPCAPTLLTVDTCVYINTTTPAATPVAGTVYVTAFYYA